VSRKHDWAAIDPQLTALYQEGLTGTVIAQRLGMSQWTVRNRLREIGLRGNFFDSANDALAPAQQRLGVPVCPKRATRRMCAQAFGVDEAYLIGPRRWRSLSIPRQATFYVLRKRFPTMSYPMIARMFAGRDHSTIIHGVRQTEARMARDPAFRAVVMALVEGRLPEQHDAHVRAWLMRGATVVAFAPAAPKPLWRAKPAEDAEDKAPVRQWCDQCQSNVIEAAAARCGQRFCSLAKARVRAVFA
jgi:hypothetical protein